MYLLVKNKFRYNTNWKKKTKGNCQWKNKIVKIKPTKCCKKGNEEKKEIKHM